MKTDIMDLERLIEFYKMSGGICTDSRKIAAGDMFFALKGENFDGNEYAGRALEAGAVCAVVERGSRLGKMIEAASANEDAIARKCVVVDDTLKALQALARWYREQFNIPVLALTGTNGKTTTKELISAVLSRKYKVSATVGNLNNSIGVPLTLFSLNASTEIAVVEMGASHPGDIKELVDIALPDLGLITNVGKAHLLGFGSFEGVMKTKGELYDYLDAHSGTAFYNMDNPYLCEMIAERGNLKRIPYGLKKYGGIILPVNAEEPFLRIKIRGRVITTHLVGSYNADNVITAIAVGTYFGVSPEDIFSAVSSYIPTNNRSELRRTSSNLLVIDAYNANPTSMQASLNNFEATEFINKLLILGDMRELGEDSYKEHKAIFDLVSRMKISKVYFVGSEFMKLKGDYPNISFFSDVEALKASLSANPLKGYTILVKGSNGIRLQSVVGML